MANKTYFSENKDFVQWIKKTIIDTFDKINIFLRKKYDEIVTFSIYKNKDFKEYYLNSILADSIGYAGTKIIRRTVSDSNVTEISSLRLSDTKLIYGENINKNGNIIYKK